MLIDKMLKGTSDIVKRSCNRKAKQMCHLEDTIAILQNEHAQLNNEYIVLKRISGKMDEILYIQKENK